MCRTSFLYQYILKQVKGKHLDSSCECQKVVSDILGEIVFFTDFVSIGQVKWHILSYRAKYFIFLWKKSDVKSNEIERKSAHKINFPVKMHLYDLFCIQPTICVIFLCFRRTLQFYGLVIYV